MISIEDQRRSSAMLEAMAVEDQKKQGMTLEDQCCFVCYLDLDGFKQAVMSRPKELYDEYQRQSRYMISSFFRAIASIDGNGLVQTQSFDKLVWPYMFSDSWFFASIDDTAESLRQISTAAAGIMMRCWEIGFPARGGIGGGKLWWNPEQQIVLGPAIVNAYAVAESLDCFGIAIHQGLSSRAADGAFTSPIRAPVERCKWIGCRVRSREQLRFACLHAHKTNRTWNIERYLQHFDEMAKKYEVEGNAKRRVVRRYRESRCILEKMLQAEPDHCRGKLRD